MKAVFHKYKKYLNRYVITALVAAVWMLFLDRYDAVSQYKMMAEVSKLESDVAFYEKEIERVNRERLMFRENALEVEKFAREHYLMKKDNEDLFVVVP
jgi:cell division protein FtsB